MGERTSGKQISFRATPEFWEMLERHTDSLRSKTGIMLAGLILFDRLSPEEQEEVLREVKRRLKKARQPQNQAQPSGDMSQVLVRAADRAKVRDSIPQQERKKKRIGQHKIELSDGNSFFVRFGLNCPLDLHPCGSRVDLNKVIPAGGHPCPTIPWPPAGPTVGKPPDRRLR